MSGLWGEKSVFIIPIIPRQILLAFIMVNPPLGHCPPHKKTTTEFSTQGNRAFLFKCILWWIVEHLVVSNSNNLSQLKKNK